MNIIDESFVNKEEEKKNNTKNTKKIILIFIIILVVAIIAIVALLVSMREIPLTVVLDGNKNTEIPEMLYFDEEGSIYVPIKRIASSLGYEAFNGEYLTKSEEKNKCYVQSQDEVIELQLNSKRVYRTGLTDSKDFEYYDLSKEVKSMNGELYITAKDMEKVFNTASAFSEKNNQFTIATLPYLINQYTNTALDYGYDEIDKSITNQKAIFNDMLVVKKKTDNTYGVIDLNNGEAIIECKYSEIKYLPSIGDFIVTSKGKSGVVSSKKETKVQVVYDKIELIDKEAGLYAAKKDNKYGVIDLKGGSKISVEFDEIGVDINKFKENGIKNKYILAENLIPVKKGELWGMFDLKGNQVVDFYYDSFGYVASSNKRAINLLVIPGYNVVVACKDKKYALINQSGQPLFAPVVDDIYMIYEDAKYSYIMNYNNQTMNVEEYLKSIGISEDDTRNMKQENSTDTNTENNTNQANNSSENNTTNNTSNNNTTNNTTKNIN